MTNGKAKFRIEEKSVFVWVLIGISVAFLWLLWPFAAPILWACILAVLFQSVYQRCLRQFPQRRNLAALLTTLSAVIVVVLPVSFVLLSIIAEIGDWLQKYEAGETSFGSYFDRVVDAFPVVRDALQSFGISLDDLKEQVGSYTASVAEFATRQSLAIGQNALVFLLNCGLMLYLAFFLLRDGAKILNWIRVAFPLDDDREVQLFAKFTEVTRATVKGNLIIGLLQGALGGIIFWILDVQPALLWGVLMAMASLVPSVGTVLVWGPVAIYFLVVGSYGPAVALIGFGVLVIGLVDNILRPVLVGRDTKLPDYIVLLSTFGGIALVGVHGFVVGPLLAALFFSLWTMFILEFNAAGAKRLALDDELDSWEPTHKESSGTETKTAD